MMAWNTCAYSIMTTGKTLIRLVLCLAIHLANQLMICLVIHFTSYLLIHLPIHRTSHLVSF